MFRSPNPAHLRFAFGVLAGLVGASSGLGCSIRAVSSVAQPTALERQLIGAYEELDRDLIYVSSYRGDPALIAERAHTQRKVLALEARALQRYHADELSELRVGGCVMEGPKRTLQAKPCEHPIDPVLAKRTARIIADENRSRRAITTWAVHALARAEGRPSPAPKDYARVHDAERRLHQKSPPEVQ